MNPLTDWTPWTPPYDPRWADGVIVAEDEHGRLIESADCGRRCPGCGLCCTGYRDTVSPDYGGVEEFEGNLKLVRGGLVPLEGGVWYRISTCGESCPGYGRCCPPFDLRQHPQTVADARRTLLESETSWRWEMEEALVFLAHEGTAEAVEVLEAYMPRAHTRLEGFAECALDEGRYFASAPHNEEEVLQQWEDRAAEAYSQIWDVLEPELERLRYELEIARRLLAKAPDETARQTWQIQVDALESMIGMTEHELAQQQEELALCEAMIAEIQADLAADPAGS